MCRRALETSEHPLELLLEARQAAAAIDQMLAAAGPGRMRLGVDVEGERVALLAVGRVGLKLSPVGHQDLDHVIVGMEIVLLFHRDLSPLGLRTAASRRSVAAALIWSGPSYTGCPSPFQGRAQPNAAVCLT